MKAVFEGEQEREWNKLNGNSVKLRNMDIDEIDNMQIITFSDDSGKKISDAEIYLPPNKAYIVIKRVHFGEAGEAVSDGDKKGTLKKMINYLLYPGNLKYLASAIYVEISESGMSDDMIEELGFYPRSDARTIFRLLNKDFEQFLEHAPADKATKDKMIQTYRELKEKEKDYLDTIRKQLERAREALQAFTDEENETMIKAKKIEIEHYEEILGIRQKSKGR